jgi:hypothetical protein
MPHLKTNQKYSKKGTRISNKRFGSNVSKPCNVQNNLAKFMQEKPLVMVVV